MGRYLQDPSGVDAPGISQVKMAIFAPKKLLPCHALLPEVISLQFAASLIVF